MVKIELWDFFSHGDGSLLQGTYLHFINKNKRYKALNV